MPTRNQHSLFCDLSTPKNDGTFSVYNDIRKKLIERGIPESEVKFIHEADTDMKKKNCSKTRKGEVGVLPRLYSEAGEQEQMCRINLSHFTMWIVRGDLPDLEHVPVELSVRGNENPLVDIYRYVTEQTFDAYLYQLVEGKQKFASQIMTSKSHSQVGRGY